MLVYNIFVGLDILDLFIFALEIPEFFQLLALESFEVHIQRVWLREIDLNFRHLVVGIKLFLARNAVGCVLLEEVMLVRRRYGWGLRSPIADLYRFIYLCRSLIHRLNNNHNNHIRKGTTVRNLTLENQGIYSKENPFYAVSSRNYYDNIFIYILLAPTSNCLHLIFFRL